MGKINLSWQFKLALQLNIQQNKKLQYFIPKETYDDIVWKHVLYNLYKDVDVCIGDLVDFLLTCQIHLETNTVLKSDMDVRCLAFGKQVWYGCLGNATEENIQEHRI